MAMRDLDDYEKISMLEFLLYRVGQDTRRKLMAEMPVAYVKLYPTTRDAVIGRVKEALEKL